MRSERISLSKARPSPDEIMAARLAAGHTQDEAARLVHLSRRDRWSEFERGIRPIEPARWELYLLLTDQHPTWRLARRRARRPADGPRA